jgi:hypothetical protein
VDNNPLKYIDPTGHAKVISADISLADYELDVLSPIEETYRNNELFYFPENYDKNLSNFYQLDKTLLLPLCWG